METSAGTGGDIRQAAARDLEAEAERRMPEMELASVMGIGRSFAIPYLSLLVIFTLLLWGRMPTLTLVAWIAIYLAYISLRTRSTAQYHADPDHHEPWRLPYWRRSVMLSSLCHGSILGSLAFIALPYLSLPMQFGVVGIVSAVCAAGAVYVAGMLGALNMLVLCALLPYVVAWMVLLESPVPMGPFLLLGLALILHLNSRHHRALATSFRLIATSEKLSAELGHKNRLLEASHISRTRLIATASHELRQPVHTLGLLISRLDPRQPAQKLQDTFVQLEQACSIVTEMLAELMDLSKLETHEYRPRIVAVDMDALMEQIRLTYGHLARGKGLVLTTQSSGQTAMSDANLLRRILFNMVANAVRYTQAGSIRVTCRIEGGTLVVSVHDTGPGIPADHIVHAFEDYVRLDDHRGAPGQALGLGLAIVRRACSLLGHTVSVESTPGEGSVFNVRVPSADRAAVSEDARRALHPAPSARQILVIENERGALDAMCELLETWGHLTTPIASERELAGLPATPGWPDAIISDLHLDGIRDGFALIAQVRAKSGRADLPALLVTGDVDPTISRRAREHGITLAHKPLAPSSLRRELDLLLATAPAP